MLGSVGFTWVDRSNPGNEALWSMEVTEAHLASQKAEFIHVDRGQAGALLKITVEDPSWAWAQSNLL